MERSGARRSAFAAFRRLRRFAVKRAGYLLFVSWLTAELLLRVTAAPMRIAWTPEWPSYDYVAFRWLLARAPSPRSPYWARLDPAFGGQVRCNRMDCRRPGGGRRVRIVCLGGSTTFGDGVNNEETYPAQMETALNAQAAPGGEYEVINAGLPGTTAVYGSRRLDWTLDAYRPDAVAYGYGGLNDSLRVHFRETRYEPLSGPRRALRSSQIYRVAENLVYRYVLYPEEVTRVTEDEYVAAVESSLGRLLARGVKVVVLTENTTRSRPFVIDPAAQARYAARLLELARAAGVGAVDADQLFGQDKERFFLNDGVHWTAEGCGRVAAGVADALARAGALR